MWIVDSLLCIILLELEGKFVEVETLLIQDYPRFIDTRILNSSNFTDNFLMTLFNLNC